MIMKKIGEDYYNGKCRNVYLILGTATKDAEDKSGSTPHVNVNLALGEDTNGEKKYIGVDGWRNRAADLRGIQKGDAVLAIGTVATREYNGKTYTNFDVMFACVSGGKAAEYATVSVSSGEGVFIPADDDEDEGELPF